MSKEEYIKFCEDNKSCIFSEPWWLDAVAGEDNWNVMLYKKGGTIQSAMPYAYTRKSDWITIKQPLLTQRNGAVFIYPKNQKYTSKLSFEKKALKFYIEEIEKLKISSFSQAFSYNFTNWLPFYWNGYNQITRYSYVIEDTSDKEKVYQQIDSSTKNLIRKAEKTIKVYEDLDLKQFYKINSMTFERKNIDIPYSFELLARIDMACKTRNCSKILYAKDKNENIHAAIYLVWDSESIYYILGGINPDFKTSNSTSLLIKEAIFLASDLGLKFDFEGSMNEDIERFFSTFGGIQKQYFTISKSFKFNFKNTLHLVINNSSNCKKALTKLLKK